MDDNEAEVDLAVNASLIRKISDDNEQPEDVATESKHSSFTPDTTTSGSATVTGDVESEMVQAAEQDLLGEVDNSGPPPTAENAGCVGSQGDDADDGEEMNDVLAEGVETVIGVSSVVSRDHVSPTSHLKFTASNKIKDPESQAAAAVETASNASNQTSQTPQTLSGSAGSGDVGASDAALDFSGNVVEMRVNNESGEEVKIPVRIIDATYKKPFLGGFRNKRTGVEFLNASSQTYPKKVIPKNVEVFSRDTQTVEKKSQTQQTMYDTSTQV